MLTKSLKRSGWNPVIRCFGGKRIDWGIQQIRAQRAWVGLPEIVIVALGTNDMRWIDTATTKTRIEKILDQLGPKRSVLWVNLYGGNGDRFSKSKQAWFNKTLAKIASKRGNVSVLAWAGKAKEAKIPCLAPFTMRIEDSLHVQNSPWTHLIAFMGRFHQQCSNTPVRIGCITR